MFEERIFLHYYLQETVSNVLWRAYLRFAKQFAFVSALMLITTVILKALRTASGPL